MATGRTRSNRRNQRARKRRADRHKNKKLGVMWILILLAFTGLSVRLVMLTTEEHDEYLKKVLSQQKYDSKTLPFKRGMITDRNGTILAVSEKVYNVVLDCKVMLANEGSTQPTVNALVECFGLDRATIMDYIEAKPNSQYYVLKKHLTYEEVQVFETMEAMNENIHGVWFEDEYIRNYPSGTLACDVIGFTGTDNNGTFGLEEYYNDELNGTNGREYGYVNDDSNIERTTVAAVDGYTLQSTIDANIQSIVEKYIVQFNEEHKDYYREGLGSTNTGCIVMDIHSGEILAMASYPNYDLNNPKDLTAYYTQEEIDTMIEEETYYETLNQLWRNFCISDTYEPGSTAKAITLATGLETGRIQGNESYECPGYHTVADTTMRCNLRRGHGILDVSGSLEQSCNVAFMKMAESIGESNILEFENIFNLGLKTNIDLVGEPRTDALIYNEESMRSVELATTSFGQGFNVTMIQMISAYSSIINGGYYYEPHMVNKILNSSGDTIENIEPRVLKQTVSATTSQQMLEYLNAVVAEGTGRTARPAGYAIGGKTGTAEKVPRDKTNYVVSFLGHAPANDPQIAIYVVIDEPNEEEQDHAYYATGIVRNILTEVLPYLHITKTEDMTVAEQQEVENVLGPGAYYVVDSETGELVDAVTGEEAEKTDSYLGEGTAQ